MYTYTSLGTQRCPGYSKLIVTPAVYPRLVLNYDNRIAIIAIYPYKPQPTQLRISKTCQEHSRGSPEFPI